MTVNIILVWSVSVLLPLPITLVFYYFQSSIVTIFLFPLKLNMREFGTSEEQEGGLEMSEEWRRSMTYDLWRMGVWTKYGSQRIPGEGWGSSEDWRLWIRSGLQHTNLHSVVSSDVHSSTVTHIDNTNHWIDPRLEFLPDWC